MTTKNIFVKCDGEKTYWKIWLNYRGKFNLKLTYQISNDKYIKIVDKLFQCQFITLTLVQIIEVKEGL